MTVFSTRPIQNGIDEEPSMIDNPLPDEPEVGELALDIYDSPDRLFLLAPIAGIEEKDLHVEFDAGVLHISGFRGRPIAIEDLNVKTQEIFWGLFRRSIVLPPGIDTKKMEARIRHSMLEIQIPKLPESVRKTIPVQFSETEQEA